MWWQFISCNADQMCNVNWLEWYELGASCERLLAGSRWLPLRRKSTSIQCRETVAKSLWYYSHFQSWLLQSKQGSLAESLIGLDHLKQKENPRKTAAERAIFTSTSCSVSATDLQMDSRGKIRGKRQDYSRIWHRRNTSNCSGIVYIVSVAY
ncbi:uncharacterized protein BO80DRAFT_137215 [Aspergillus ibericus CBS 121593]|uniref:Uncharacterized protein n=1 Tax=Aspergillus ibericus CBS 121593 TaxID=1448316 RepID=A0A395HEN4_9EURO|nr:hypothetical protein BO80DRAFT_137215 [Aspergillus ibericus CBS 121593]RAL05458.1 hypothetical protein BO80DRAFT_137215 [Aspergillus ibericus CBS 121593]